jgi:polysaccharide biosynthesis/export protein
MSISRRHFTGLSIGLMFLLPGVALGQVQMQSSINAGVPTDRTADSTADPKTAIRPAPTERYPRYRINRDDVMSLSFPLSPEFNQPKVMVQPDGFVTLQGAGSIYVAGLTVPQAVDAVKKAYSKTLHEPIVDIDLVDFQRPYFVVFGQVGKPGQYDLRYDMTLTEAVAVAGGFAPTAKSQAFLYHRDTAGGGWVEAKEFKLKDMLHGKNVTEDVSLRPGDMIFVPEKMITKVRKYIPYGVGTSINPAPGLY